MKSFQEYFEERLEREAERRDFIVVSSCRASNIGTWIFKFKDTLETVFAVHFDFCTVDRLTIQLVGDSIKNSATLALYRGTYYNDCYGSNEELFNEVEDEDELLDVIFSEYARLMSAGR